MRFGIGSNTKTFIAVILLKLQEQGVLSLDDPLYRWLPAIPHVDSAITIRQMLSHQSGIFNFSEAGSISLLLDDTSHFWTCRETLALIEDPYFERGTSYRYSNTNYLLAGMIIDTATGKSWIQNLHELILDPLNMTSTFVGAYEKINGPVAHEWIANYGEVALSPMTSEYSRSNAAGAMLSTAGEMAEWYQALFHGEVISRESLLELTDFESTSFYGLGMMKTLYKDHLTYTHTGGMLGYTSGVYYDMNTKAIMCLLINDTYTDFDARITPFLNVFFDDFPKKQHDAGISRIIRPTNGICDGTVIPCVMLTNCGNAPLMIADINYQVDTTSPLCYKWIGVLNTGGKIHIELPPVTMGNGYHSLTCYTSFPNAEQEDNTYNDTARTNFLVNTIPEVTSELYESFDGNLFPPDGWTISSSALKGHWVSTSFAHYTGTGSAVYTNFNDRGIGNFYDLELPALNISGSASSNLSFRYAYGLYPGFYGDSLQVIISQDCGISWQQIFNRGGSRLATCSSSIAFYPLTKSKWRKETISLSGFTGNVLIRFRNICGYGNNIFLDDVEIKQLTGIRETILTDNFMVYPNPASSEIKISGLPANSEIQIIDLSGKLLMTRKTADSLITIDILQLPNGVYFLRTAFGTKKIVKM